MANDIIPSGSPFHRAAEQVKAKRRAEVLAPKKETTSASIRARLNFIPDNDTLHGMIDNALSALSRGIRWARGSILNLIV